MWQVMTWKPQTKAGQHPSYGGGSSNEYRTFTYQADAHRWAKDQVEVGKAWTASVTEVAE